MDLSYQVPYERLNAMASHPINRALGWLKRHSFFSGAIAYGQLDTLPYPEITGYTIPTLRSWGEREWAFRSAIWLASIQEPNGGFRAPDGLVYVFDTAQALRGFLAVLPDLPYLESNARRAAQYMMDQLEETGLFKSRYGGSIPDAIHLFALKPLFDAGMALAEAHWADAVGQILARYKGLLGESGWNMQAHYWGYVLEGLLEMGEQDLVRELSQDLLGYQNENGSFPAYPGASWVDASGTAQLAGVLFRTGQSEAGVRAVQYLESAQSPSGGFLGSYGPGAGYFVDREISWPVKFFLDAYRLRISAYFEGAMDEASVQSDKSPVLEARWQYLEGLLGDLNGKRVLQAGCGREVHLQRLAAMYPQAHLLGLDISRTALQRLGDSAEPIEGTVLDIPLPDGSLDVVYCIDVLRHSVRPAAAIREMCRVLRAGGKVVIMDKNDNGGRQAQLAGPSWERWFTAEELVEMLAEHCVDVHVQGHRCPEDGAEPTYLIWMGTRASSTVLREDASALAARVEVLRARVEEKAQTVEDLRAQVEGKEQALQVLAAQLADKEQALRVMTAQVSEKDQAAQALTAEVAQKEQAARVLEADLQAIYTSRTWRLVGIYWRLRQALRTARETALGKPWRVVKRLARRFLPVPVKRAIRSRIYVAPLPSSPAIPSNPVLQLHDFLTAQTSAEPERLVLIFSTMAFVESEGQRATFLAREFARRGNPVVFSYWRWSFDELAPQSASFTNVFQIPIDLLMTCAGDVFGSSTASVPMRIFLMEFPHPFLFELVNLANANGWTTLYDVIDDWEEFSRVGQAPWYDREFEQYLALNVDSVAATSEVLRQKMLALGAAQVPLWPNALEPGSSERSQEPIDLPTGELTAGYFGQLTDSWFDWKLIVQVAKRNPDWVFHVIGYGEPQGLRLPPNVLFLGKIERARLAAYAANWDVAIIPFRKSKLGEAVDPIKVYEYLALGLPVVCTGMPHLSAYPSVWNASNPAEFEKCLREASAADLDRQAIHDFLMHNTWPRRVDAIVALASAPQHISPITLATVGAPTEVRQ